MGLRIDPSWLNHIIIVAVEAVVEIVVDAVVRWVFFNSAVSVLVIL